MDNQKLAEKLNDLCGGKENIINAENCMTRLRIEFKDRSLVKEDEIKKTEDVLGVVSGDVEIQIVLGPGKVAKVAAIFEENMKNGALSSTSPKVDDWKANKDKHKKNLKGQGVQRALKKISQIFVPLIPGIMASGLLLGFSELINTLNSNGAIESDSFLLVVGAILSLLGKACFEVITVFVGINAAKVFKCTPILGGMVGCLVTLAGVVELAKTVDMFLSANFNITQFYYCEADPEQSLLFTGKGGVIGVIIGVWIMSKIEHWLKKRIPDTLDLMVTPLVCFLITGLLMLFLLMPVAGLISDYISAGLSFLGTSPNIIVKSIYGFILGAFYLPLVLLGLHTGLLPIYLVEIAQQGYTMMLCPQLMAGFAQVGCAICIYVKAKSINHKVLCKTIAGALPSGILGIGEPLIYGMTLPIAIAFVPIGLAAGVAGIFIALMECKALAYGAGVLLSIPTIDPSTLVPYLIGGLGSAILGFVFSWFIVSKKRIQQHKDTIEFVS